MTIKQRQNEIYIDPAQLLSKAIADFRKEVDYITMRRVIWAGNIETVKPEQPNAGFCVIYISGI